MFIKLGDKRNVKKARMNTLNAHPCGNTVRIKIILTRNDSVELTAHIVRSLNIQVGDKLGITST